MLIKTTPTATIAQDADKLYNPPATSARPKTKHKILRLTNLTQM